MASKTSISFGDDFICIFPSYSKQLLTLFLAILILNFFSFVARKKDRNQLTWSLIGLASFFTPFITCSYYMANFLEQPSSLYELSAHLSKISMLTLAISIGTSLITLVILWFSKKQNKVSESEPLDAGLNEISQDKKRISFRK